MLDRIDRFARRDFEGILIGFSKKTPKWYLRNEINHSRHFESFSLPNLLSY